MDEILNITPYLPRTMCSAVLCKVISVDGLESNQLVLLQLVVVRLGRGVPWALESRETVGFSILLGWLGLLFLGCHGVALSDARWVAGTGLEDSRTLLRVEFDSDALQYLSL